MGNNPYHNQHIAEFTACMDEALTAMNQNHLAVFTEMMKRMDGLEKRIEKLEQAKEQPGEVEAVVSPHTLRNNFAKRCLLSGMDIYTLSRILGHSSVSVTEKAYLDVTDDDLKKRYSKFSPLEGIYYKEE